MFICRAKFVNSTSQKPSFVFLFPLRIVSPSLLTFILFWVSVTTQPSSHSWPIDNSDKLFRSLKTFNDLDKIEEKIDGIIYDTGWFRNINNSEIFFGPNRPVVPEELVAKAKQIGVKFFGCDLPSVDASNSKDKPIHNALLGKEIIVYESLANLNQLPILTPFDFYGLPLSFKGLDGSPVRAVGFI